MTTNTASEAAGPDELATVEAELAEALARVRALEARRHELRIAPWGIQIGDSVKATRGRYAGQIMRVAEIVPMHGKPWVGAYAPRKDGSFGTQKRPLYTDWEKPDPRPAALPNGGGA